MTKSSAFEEPYLSAWGAIGYLTTSWAVFESTLFQILRESISGVPNGNDVSMMLVNGLRYAEAAKALKNVLTVSPVTDCQKNRVNEILRRANTVKKIRDIVAHKDCIADYDATVLFRFWNQRNAQAPQWAKYTLDKIILCAWYAKMLAFALTDTFVPEESRHPGWRDALLDTPLLPKDPQEDPTRYIPTQQHPPQPSPG